MMGLVLCLGGIGILFVRGFFYIYHIISIYFLWQEFIELEGIGENQRAVRIVL